MNWAVSMQHDHNTTLQLVLTGCVRSARCNLAHADWKGKGLVGYRNPPISIQLLHSRLHWLQIVGCIITTVPDHLPMFPFQTTVSNKQFATVSPAQFLSTNPSKTVPLWSTESPTVTHNVSTVLTVSLPLGTRLQIDRAQCFHSIFRGLKRAQLAPLNTPELDRVQTCN